MAKNFYVTNAIPYVNAPPHVGHALEFVQADVITRYQRLLGKDVFALTGTDNNALKNVQAAEEKGVPVAQFVKKNADQFLKLEKLLNINFDDFIQTTEKRHVQGAQSFWKACKKEDIYKKKYKGLYCLGCEVFLTKKELADGKCPEHQKKPELVEEENYFFRLSKYQDWLEDLIVTDKLKIIPEIRKNEVLAFIRQGLKDFSISRTKERAHGWGIPVPENPNQIVYVWFDALANYITALNWQNNGKLFKKYWPADVHVIGKGITRFHAIYWPAMLKSAGLPIPKQEFVHGYITIEGQKISKSLGNVVDPFELIEKYGVDPIRYYLLREIPAYGDGDFSEQRFVELYNADLANGLGNLLSRVLTLVAKNNNSKVPPIDKDPDSHPLRINPKIHNWKKSWQEIDQFLPEYRFDEALESIWKFIGEADKYIDQNKPWDLAKKNKKDFNWVVYGLLDALHQVAWQIYPFLPETSQKIAKRLKIEKLLVKNPLNKDSWTNIKSGNKIEVGRSLFPRLEKPIIGQKTIGKLKGEIVIGEIKNLSSHPQADKLKIAEVDIGSSRKLTIVCGALNLKKGQVVPVALPGSRVKQPNQKILKVKKPNIRGTKSEAMLCSAFELGLGRDHEKIFILNPNLASKIGQPLKKFLKIYVD